MTKARYADGQSALIAEIGVAIGEEGVRLALAGGGTLWPWDEIARADDRVHDVILRRQPDTGARLTLDPDAVAAARAFYPTLFRMRSQRIGLVAGLTTISASLAAFFLIGIPMLAETVARMTPPAVEVQLAAIADGQMRMWTEECLYGDTGPGHAKLVELADRLGDEAGLAREQYYIDLVEAPFANAFAMPGGKIMITNQLLQIAETPDEIAGVIAHELAHVKERHILTSIVRQAGIGIFIDIVFGGTGVVLAATSMNLMALQYSREDEAEADRLAVQYLQGAGIDPGGMANFLERMDHMSAADTHLPEFFNSHPDTGRRAAALRPFAHPGLPPALDAQSWEAVQAACPWELPNVGDAFESMPESPDTPPRGWTKAPPAPQP